MTNIEVRFLKTHPNAILPQRNHGNRKPNDIENVFIEKENVRLQNENPQAYDAGYRVGFPFETDEQGKFTQCILGTGDTGYDVFCVEDKVISAKDSAIVDTGIELAYVSPGFWFKVETRSGLGFKHGIMCHPGIVDNCYQGNLSIKMYNFSNKDYEVKRGDRIAQLVFYPMVEPNIRWSEEKHATDRSVNGFGSSGR